MTDQDNIWDTNYDKQRDYLAFTTIDINNILSHVLPDAPKTSLDIGCGTGQVPRELFHRGYQATGIDGSIKAIEIAQQSTIYDANGIEYIHTIFESFAPPTTYGLITCKYVIAFVEDKNVFLQKAEQLLDESGVLVIISPDITSLPPERSSIAMPHGEMLEHLAKVFEVQCEKRNKDLYYFCHKKYNK